MKKNLLPLLLAIFVICSCKKDNFDTAKQASTDDAAIRAYIAANHINASKDPSGLYYSIVTAGSGNQPDIHSTITVNSTGKLLNGTVFDTETALNIPLSETIRGWQIGIPFISTGGRILLIIPSALGYGDQANGSIPKNSVLIFTVDLLGFSN